jgi:hypothetical protein
MSFDTGFNINTFELIGYDSTNNVLRRISVDPNGNIAVSLSSGPLNGQAKIAVTGTAVRLGASTLLNGVVVTAKSTNVAPIVVGTSSVTNVTDGTGPGYILEAGSSASWAITNSNELYINGTAGDIISWAGS